MTDRVRISTSKRVAIFRDADGICHICSGKITVGDRWEVSHRIPLELGGADDPSNWSPAHYRCHRHLTATVDIPNIARAKRREAKFMGADRPSRPIPGSRASGLRKRFDGSVVRRDP